MQEKSKIVVLSGNCNEWPQRLEPGAAGVEISGPSSENVDQELYLSNLAALHGREQISGVWIKATSRLVDCRLLQAFPNARSLSIASTHVRALAGIEFAPQLAGLVIETRKANRIDLTAVVSSSITRLRIEKARVADLKLVGVSSIEKLNLIGGELGDELNDLIGPKVSDLTLVRTRLRQFDAPASFGVMHLQIAYCKDFTGFGFPLPSVQHLIIEACASFDVCSLAQLGDLRTVRLLGCRKPFAFESIPKLPLLQEIVITNCKVSFDVLRLKGMDSLRCLFVSPMRRGELIQKISVENPGVMVTNGDVAYLAGAAKNVADYYSYRQSN